MYDLQIERCFSFSDETLAELLFSVSQGDSDPLDLIFDDFRQTGIKRFLEQAIEVERDIHLGFDHYRRGIGKEDSRNGYYERDLELSMGLIEDLRIPRTRKNTFKSMLISNYQRRQKSVEGVIRDMFTRGVSTRQVGEVLGQLLGIEPSATTVSRIAKSLDEEVRAYKKRWIGDDYVYLILDGVTMKVKEAPHATKKLVLCVYGITSKGVRRLLSFQQEKSEGEAAWERVLNDVYKRGLVGDNLKLIATDGGQGLINALGTVYPYVPRQRCWAHKLRNVSNCCSRANEKEVIADARAIYLADTRREAMAAFKEWQLRWAETEPGAVECLSADLEDLLTVFSLPLEHRKMMRTTNVIERLFREVRRRTRPMSCFTNAASCDRIIYAVFVRFNRHWEDHPLAQFTQQA
jgi:putative transposase